MPLYKVDLTPRGLRDCEMSAHHEHGVVTQITPDEERRLYRRDDRVLVVLARKRPIAHRAIANVEDITVSDFGRGDIVRGVLRASPTQAEHRHGTRGKVRAILEADRQVEWFERKLKAAGLAVVDLDVTAGTVVHGVKKGTRITHNCAEVRFKAEVADAPLLAAAREAGIGRGKAYGLGLLLVALCRS